MSVLLSPPSRLLGLIIGTTILWTIESLLPLYRYEKHRLRRALPNIAFTVLLVLTNLLLSFVTSTARRMAPRLLAVAMFGIPPSVVIVYLVISTLNAQLEHTNIKLFAPLDRVLRFLIVTPNMHKVHHSRLYCSSGFRLANLSNHFIATKMARYLTRGTKRVKKGGHSWFVSLKHAILFRPA